MTDDEDLTIGQYLERQRTSGAETESRMARALAEPAAAPPKRPPVLEALPVVAVRGVEPPWTIKELARVAACSPALVRKAIACGSLQAHRVGRLVRIPAPEARRFAADLGAVAVSPAHETHDAHETQLVNLGGGARARAAYLRRV